ncbi:MAG: thiamine phosphate synthase [Lachnospiraceae bacterium]|nr:thiamine phosphate synthase [Lachnospiraceae bacterium]
MTVKREDLLLYAITDRSWLAGNNLADVVRLAAEGGITFLQYREKTLSYDEKKKEALEIKKICREFDIPFVVNDDVNLAKDIDADGVHVGQADMAVSKAREILGKDKIIGATAKTVEQALKAQAEGADYLGSGALFGSNTKKDAIPMTKDLFNAICESVDIPVVAIGGITLDNIDSIIDSNMSGVAIISGIFAADDIKNQTMRFRDILDKRIIKR